MRRPSLKHQIKLAIDAQLKIGQSKYQAKKELRCLFPTGQRWLDGIYSIKTAENTRKKAISFANWAKATHECKWLEECKQYVTEYLITRQKLGDSPSTLKNRRGALRRLFNDPNIAKDFKAPIRYRSAIIRSRYPVIRDKHFSTAKNKELITFCVGTGLRRHEVAAAKPENVFKKDGNVYVYVPQGKGGKERTVQVWGPYAERVWEIARSRDGHELIFKRIHSHADIQSFRRQFAHAKYLELTHRAFSAKDYDKKALAETSVQLGHGLKRRDVILSSYMV